MSLLRLDFTRRTDTRATRIYVHQAELAGVLAGLVAEGARLLVIATTGGAA